MCKCKDVEMGSYDNQVMLKSPAWSSKEHICVDACLEDEIKNLWRTGIVTNGCCCGHNIAHPYIGVDDASVPFMEGFGYRHVVNPARPEVEKSHFYPLNAGYTPNEAWAIASQHYHDYYMKKGKFARSEECSYLVSYKIFSDSSTAYTGMCNITRQLPIKCYDDIVGIRDALAKKHSEKVNPNIIILNYKRFEDD